MKHILSIIISLFIFSAIHAQDFDTNLEALAKDLSLKIDSKEKKKIAVWGFVTEGGERTALANYLTEDFSIYMTNFGDKFEIIDRKHLDMILKEHKLNSEGYIDKATAKELQKIIAVDAIVTGTYTVLSTKIKVRAKVLDTETALQFAANMASLPMNEDVNSYLGIAVNEGNNPNKGFNTPLNSNETINNPETVDSKCKEEKFGDLCFYNSTNSKLVIRAKYFKEDEGSRVKITDIFIDPSETKCIYKIKNRTLSYYAATWDTFQKELGGGLYRLNHDSFAKYLYDKGEIKIETCKSKTYTIK